MNLDSIDDINFFGALLRALPIDHYIVDINEHGRLLLYQTNDKISRDKLFNPITALCYHVTGKYFPLADTLKAATFCNINKKLAKTIQKASKSKKSTPVRLTLEGALVHFLIKDHPHPSDNDNKCFRRCCYTPYAIPMPSPKIYEPLDWPPSWKRDILLFPENDSIKKN